MIYFPVLKRDLFTISAFYGLAKYALELLAVGGAYLVLAQFSLALASIHASVAPVWLPAGLAVAAVLLLGLRVWPAILVAALIANLSTGIANASDTNWILSSSIVAVGNTLQAIVCGHLIVVWSDGCGTFDTPMGIARFTSAAGLSSAIDALIGVGALSLAGYAEWSGYGANVISRWLGDLIGTLMVAPVIVLWTMSDIRTLTRTRILASCGAIAAAIVVGLLVWSPLFEHAQLRSSLALLSALPVLWAGLRCGPRDTATVALILSCFAIWGAVSDSRLFNEAAPNDGFMLLAALILGFTVTGLALAAEVATRDRFEARLRQREYNLRNLFAQTGAGVAQTDTAGRFVLVNQQFCNIVRRPMGELLQIRVQDLADPEERSHFLALLEQAVDTGKGFAVESSHTVPDGARFWLRSRVSAISDPNGTVRYLMFVIEDITVRRTFEQDTQDTLHDLREADRENKASLEASNGALQAEVERRKLVEGALRQDIAERRKAQEALMESEWRFRLFIQGVTDYAIFMLDPDGHITNWNTGAQRIHQYTGAEIIGQHFSKFYSEEEQQRGEPARALQAAAYEGKYVTEGQYLRRDKSSFWASVVIEAIRDEEGTLVGFAEITRDITERREAQASLERAQEQLAQSQKMEALGQLTGSIAHDFNNLLMIVSGHAQLLGRRLTDPKQLQAVSAVHTAANRGESLTRQLLAFSRRQPLNPVVADLKERVEAVHDMLVGSLRGNVELKRDIAADIWPIEVDIAELELAMVNIAVNARDAMPGGGSITLSAQNVTLKKSDGIELLEGDHVALAMTDTGVGIAPDILPRIFEPFFTTKALGKGTGLGLSQVYGFSRQSGGTVVVTSKIGSGTTVAIYLPRKHGASIKTTELPPLQSFVPGQGTILVVEDNAEVAEVTTSLIEQLGYRTLRAENATDALSRLQRGQKIDLVFSDVVMPGSMNGIALAQEIANRYPRIPVLLTSGYSDVVQTVSSQLPILRKPFQLSALEKFIREALDRNIGHGDHDRVIHFPRMSVGR